MKTLITLVLLGLQTFTTYAQTDSLTADIFLSQKTYDFNHIEAGEKISHVFEFENSGKAPLIIEKVLTTCGCTVPSWPKEPLAPGETSQIEVIFDSTGKIGRQNKIITIRSNASSGDKRLILSGMVLPKKE